VPQPNPDILPLPTAANPHQWVDLHADALFRFAMLRVRNQTHAEELVQETFVSALTVLASFKSSSSERTWLVGILKHKILDHFRKSRRDPDPIPECDPVFDKAFHSNGHWKTPPAHWSFDPARLSENTEFWLAFQSCLSALPEKMANAFALRILDDESPENVCQVLNITATNLWMLLSRARGRLRQCLESKYFADEQDNE
jgi:RNA polymerase sigma-70 factor (ECF subfamily)